MEIQRGGVLASCDIAAHAQYSRHIIYESAGVLAVSISSNDGGHAHPGSVTDGILDAFFLAMRDDADLATVEPALRNVVMTDRLFGEAAIRAALLPEAP